jgi:hypothetical protein
VQNCAELCSDAMLAAGMRYANARLIPTHNCTHLHIIAIGMSSELHKTTHICNWHNYCNAYLMPIITAHYCLHYCNNEIVCNFMQYLLCHCTVLHINSFTRMHTPAHNDSGVHILARIFTISVGLSLINQFTISLSASKLIYLSSFKFRYYIINGKTLYVCTP